MNMVAPHAHSGADSLYADNSGTTLAVVGEGFCIMAGDTRHAEEYHINTRKATKLFVVDGRMVLSTAGFYADSRFVYEQLTRAVETYEFRFSRKMGVVQAAAVLHTILYSYRFFPRYAFCCLGGIGDDGKPKLFSYDPIGSYQETPCKCNGSGSKLLQPFLDSWISKKNWHGGEGKDHKLTLEEEKRLVIDAFNSAAETDVKTGDCLEMYVIAPEGTSREEHELRSD